MAPSWLARAERGRVLAAAARFLGEAPVTVTASTSGRSRGGPHDYFSEGDYWWPDPGNPAGPYVRRDGLINPDNFLGHRRALLRLSLSVPALASAWLLTGNALFAAHAARHLRAWFLDPATLMNPNLRYAQAISGRTEGRGIGIIDTVHLVEVARAFAVLRDAGAVQAAEAEGVGRWFAAYLRWIIESAAGREEREQANNHGTCWLLQTAEFARCTGEAAVVAACRVRFREVLLPGQVAADGSFPLELARTRPYGYSLFNLDATAAVCQGRGVGPRRRAGHALATRRPSGCCPATCRSSASWRTRRGSLRWGCRPGPWLPASSGRG